MLLAELRQNFPSEGILRFTLELPRETPSNNVIKKLHFAKYRQLRKQFQTHVFMALNARRPAKPIAKSFLVVTRETPDELLDWDNAYGGLKPMVDCLVMPKLANPDGLGIIVDDNPYAMPFAPYVIQTPSSRKWTTVQVFELQS